MRTVTSLCLTVGLCLSLGACASTNSEGSAKDQPPADPAPTEPDSAGDGKDSGADPIQCGGFAGLTCPDELACVDDPSDSCDPNNGGADCMGMCVEGGKGSDCPDDETHTYVASPDKCAAIRFVCAEGSHYFADECGCGCEDDA